MQGAIRVLSAAAWGEAFCKAIEPFDVVRWEQQDIDKAVEKNIIMNRLLVLAQLVEVSQSKLTDQFMSVRHFPLRLISKEGYTWAGAWRETLLKFPRIDELKKVP